MVVHKDIISARSEFFKAALNKIKKAWKKGQTRVVRLPEDNADVVGQYLDFMYQKALPTHRFSHLDFIYIGLARLYVFGERVLDPFIRNNIVQQLILILLLSTATNPATLSIHDRLPSRSSMKAPLQLRISADCWSTCMRAMARRSGLLLRTFTLTFAWMLRACSWLRPTTTSPKTAVDMLFGRLITSSLGDWKGLGRLCLICCSGLGQILRGSLWVKGCRSMAITRHVHLRNTR
jgi:hypothetical protein